MSLELSGEQKEVARQLSECEHPREVITDLNLSWKVDAETCAEMRRAFKNDERTRGEIARDDFNVDRDTVWRHALGDCGHDVDEPPAERVGGGGKRR